MRASTCQLTCLATTTFLIDNGCHQVFGYFFQLLLDKFTINCFPRPSLVGVFSTALLFCGKGYKDHSNTPNLSVFNQGTRHEQI